MISPIKKEIKHKIAPLEKLILVMKEDTLVNEQVINLLKMQSYQRRSVLNNWLEELRKRNASEDLLSALSCLFDNKIAAEVLNIINNRR